MSASVSYTCSKCNFSSSEEFSNHQYIGPPEKEPLLRTVYCEDCDAITKAVFPYLKPLPSPQIEVLIDQMKFLKSSLFYCFSGQKKKEVTELEAAIQIEESVLETLNDGKSIWAEKNLVQI